MGRGIAGIPQIFHSTPPTLPCSPLPPRIPTPLLFVSPPSPRERVTRSGGDTASHACGTCRDTRVQGRGGDPSPNRGRFGEGGAHATRVSLSLRVAVPMPPGAVAGGPGCPHHPVTKGHCHPPRAIGEGGKGRGRCCTMGGLSPMAPPGVSLSPVRCLRLPLAPSPPPSPRPQCPDVSLSPHHPHDLAVPVPPRSLFSHCPHVPVPPLSPVVSVPSLSPCPRSDPPRDTPCPLSRS